MGGSDDKSNIVPLTPEEHYLAHLLLVKIHPDTPGLVFAVHRMSYNETRKLSNRKMYGWIRRRHSAAVSKITSAAQTGEGNSQYGKQWIYNKNTLESKRIEKDALVPDGWKKGRIQNGICPKEREAEKTAERKKKIKENYAKNLEHAYYWYNKLLESDATSIREFVKNGDYNKSHVALTIMLKKYVKEFNPRHGKPFRN